MPIIAHSQDHCIPQLHHKSSKNQKHSCSLLTCKMPLFYNDVRNHIFHSDRTISLNCSVLTVIWSGLLFSSQVSFPLGWFKTFFSNQSHPQEGNHNLLYSGFRKSSSWHTALRLKKKSEKKDKDGKREGKLENGYRKSRDGLANKVSVKVFLPDIMFVNTYTWKMFKTLNL